jgi:hypothetical protein
MKVKVFRAIVLVLISLVLIILSFFAVKYYNKSSDICMSIAEYNKLKTPIVLNTPSLSPPNISQPNISRDVKVINDPLYPPLNRENSQNFNALQSLNVPLNDIQDTYHILGYLTSDSELKDKGGNNWKLFGRMKNKNQGDFYIIPANNNYDIKIPITNDIIVGQRLTDLYSIPTEFRFRSPMLNDDVYKFTELPKTDFSSNRYM